MLEIKIEQAKPALLRRLRLTVKIRAMELLAH